jgi:hypothetical protein
MRTILLASAALALAACGGEPAAPAAPAAETPAAETPAADAGAMDADMQAADAADDANTGETPDNFMFHTDTTKVESVHLPAGAWTVTPADPAQVEIVSAADETMPDGSTHHVVKVKPLVRDVIARVKFERREGADAAAAPVETRTVMLMIH